MSYIPILIIIVFLLVKDLAAVSEIMQLKYSKSRQNHFIEFFCLVVSIKLIQSVNLLSVLHEGGGTTQIKRALYSIPESYTNLGLESLSFFFMFEFGIIDFNLQTKVSDCYNVRFKSHTFSTLQATILEPFSFISMFIHSFAASICKYSQISRNNFASF